MKKHVLLLSFIAVCFSALAQQTWKQRSLFWEITGNGLKKPCYLYGTMHVSSKMAFHLTDSFFVAMQKADAIGIESRPEEWLEGMFNSDLITSYYGMGQNRYDDYYGTKKDNTFYDLAFKNEIPKREDFAGLMALDPYLINGILYRSFQISQDFEEDTYLDMFLYQCAKKLGKETYSMENFSESMKMEILAESKRYEDEKEEENSLEEKEVIEDEDDDYGYGRKDKMEEAYRIGDLVAIDSISKKNSKSFYKYMLVERNKLMLHTFDSIAQSGKSLLAGVGAAHLPGEEGLLQLLMDMGYTVRPMKSNDAKPSKMKAKMDEMKAPLTMKAHLLEEEGIEVFGPNKFYKFPTSTASSFYLSFDMANGSFFIVNTMPTYGIWEGRSQAYILEQVDSLIYEYVAGKLISHERITNNLGYPGIKVVSKTRRGDIQKYCFFVGPQKLYSFKVSGNGDFADRKDALQFIDDINFLEKSNIAYSLFKPSHEKYEVWLPENRAYSLSTLGFRFDHQGEKITAYDVKQDILFGLTKAALYDNEFIEEDTFELSQLLRTFAKQHDAEILEQKLIAQAAFPELEGVLKRKERYIHAKIAIDANQYYLLYSISDKNVRPDEVFNSFKILPGKYLSGIVEIDTTLKYKVNITAFSDRYQIKDFVSYEDISNAYDANTSKSYYYEDDDQESDEAFFEKWIMSDHTGEFVQVYYDKFSKYFWEDTTINTKNYNNDYITYDKDRPTDVDSIGERKIRSYINIQGDSCHDVWYVRQGSRRIIWEREIIHGDTKYWLSTVMDSVSGPNDFQKVFYETFEPLRPAEPFDFYTDKSVQILNDLYADDSTVFKTARFGLEIAPSTFAKNNFKELVSAIQDSRFNSLSFDYKEMLINALAHHDKEPLSFLILDSIYNNAGDTSEYQLWVLETLSEMKTKESIAKFVNLIMEETPLLGASAYGNSYRSIFSGWRDSLELVVPHLAELMELTRIPDYKDIILDLAAETVIETKVNPEVFKSFKVFLIHEAKNELKRGNLVTADDVEDDSKPSYGYYGSDFGYNESKDYDLDKYDTIPLAERKVYPIDELGNCLVLLTQMKDEPQVKTLIDKVINAKSETPNKSNYLAILEKAGVPVKDSIWKSLSQNRTYRMDTYAYLKNLDKLSKFDSNLLQRDSLVFSTIYQNLKSNKDSIVYVGTYPIANMYYQGDIVAYKRKSTAAKKWKVDMVFITHDEKNPIDFSIEYTDKDNEVKNDREKIQKKIDEFKEVITLKGRERTYDNRY